jgi:NLR family CARD domain-containing protein 3
VLLLGRAGIGKSTLCQKIAYDWAAGALFADKFIAVYHLKLRDLNPWIVSNPLDDLQDSNEWLSSAIAKLCYQGAHQNSILHELQKHSEKILFLFDGWDEASSLLTKALSRCLRQTQAAHYLLTSRPGVTAEIQNNFNLTVENMGFTQEQIKVYAEKFFTHTETPDLPLFLQELRSRSNLLTLCHNPIQLQILCSLWHNGAQTFPQNLTSMFSKITENLLSWEQRKVSETISRTRMDANGSW